MSKRMRNGLPVLKDWHLWDEVTKTVAPLRPLPPGPAPILDQPLPQPPSPRQPARPQFEIPLDWTVGSAAGPIPPNSFSRRPPRIEDRAIEPKLRRKVMRGRIEIDATIDLHGMRQVEARAALIRFLTGRAGRGDRTVLVITGKGLKKVDATTVIERGVLRAMLPIWLAEPGLSPLVAGWGVSAQAHGGEGAFYVRLRKAPA